MRVPSICAVAVVAGIALARAQSNASAPATIADAASPDRSYQILRENENWTFLKDPALRDDFWDAIKYVPLRSGLDDWYLTFGGEVRQVWEQAGNDNWGRQPYNNAFLLERYMVHVDAHYGKHFRSFVQLKSGLESFRAGGPRPIDQKKLDLEAAFFEVSTSGGKRWIALRAGRQELNYGSGRLIAVREGPNVRQSFDGLKIRSRVGSWNIDGFAVRPDLDKPGYFDNIPDHKTAFWGVYASRPRSERVSADVYYAGIDRKRAVFNRGTARETRHSLAARLWRPIRAKDGGCDFDYEAVWQFGSFGSAGLRAWTVATDTGYSLAGVPLRPRVSVKADISSGDDPRKNRLGTFSALFPVGNYFGVLADTGPGPLNFIDVHPRVQAQLPRGVTLSTDVVVQWRESIYDGVYAVPGFLLVPAGSSRARFVGWRPGVEARWQIDRHAYFQADYGIFYAGQFLKETSPGRNINYFALWAGYNS